MKHNFLLIVLMIVFFNISCKNSPYQQQTDVEAQQEKSLKKIFKEAYANKESFRKLLENNLVKERIINEYSAKYYNKALELTIFDYGINYDGNIYSASASVTRILDDGTVDLTYNPDSDILIIEMTEKKREIRSNGEVYYNTEGWEINYPKDEFDDDITSQPILSYRISDNSELVTYNPIWIAITVINNGKSVACCLCTNLFNYSSRKIAKILIKDNINGKIYNIEYDKPYNESYTDFRYSDVGVIMYNDKVLQFIDIVSGLKNYTISFINEDEENAVVKNPQNLKNIRDAFEDFIIKYVK